MDDQILTVLNQLVETQKETNKRLDKMDTRLDSLDSKVTDNTNRLDVLEGAMKDSFDKIDSKFEKVDSRFDKIDARFEKVDARFDKIDSRFGEVDARFNKIDSRFGEVDARFDKIDSRFDDFTKDIGNLITKEVGDYISNSLSRMESKTDKIDETTNELKADIQVIKVAVAKHEDDSKYFKKHHLRQV